MGGRGGAGCDDMAALRIVTAARLLPDVRQSDAAAAGCSFGAGSILVYNQIH